MKKCVLINCFASSSENRVEPIKKWFDNHGYQTKYFSSSFHHTKKEFVELPPYITPIKTMRYKKNLSLKRLLSHWFFSKKVYEEIIKERPDVVYVKFPPNCLVKYAWKYKKKYGAFLIFDIFDLWPESLPLSAGTKRMLSPFLYCWGRPRNKYLSKADLAFVECKMYKDYLSEFLPKDTYTLYLTKESLYCQTCKPKEGVLSLCYLGSINNLIDIQTIGKLVAYLSKKTKVEMHIIGEGAKKQELIDVSKNSGATVHFYGPIYDDATKMEIMSKCDYGLNLMNKNVKVALSIKSIEYFRAGLPLLNNIPFDTDKIIDKYNAGYTIKSECDFPSISLSGDEILKMKDGSRRAFEIEFSSETISHKIDRILSSAGL